MTTIPGEPALTALKARLKAEFRAVPLISVEEAASFTDRPRPKEPRPSLQTLGNQFAMVSMLVIGELPDEFGDAEMATLDRLLARPDLTADETAILLKFKEQVRGPFVVIEGGKDSGRQQP